MKSLKDISHCSRLRIVLLLAGMTVAFGCAARDEMPVDSVRRGSLLPDVPDTLMLDGRKSLVYYPKQLDEMPEYPGGMVQLMRFLGDNFTYTISCYQPTGRNITRMLIDREGNIRQAETVQPLEKHMDEEVLRVISLMPQFKPATIGGQSVDCWYYLPVTFRDSTP